ncbi:MAG: hypothetical protein AB1513_01230 [Pseudomonadota bacterium]
MTDQQQPVYIFHHIPKCGGTSVRNILAQWFEVIMDYRRGWSMEYPEKVNLAALQPHQCLCGHYELEGHHLYQRYPEVFTSDRYRVFTFVRDPLQVRLSLFKYASNNNRARQTTLEAHLFTGNNFIARRLPVTLENYKAILDKYFFIGVLENGQASIDVLAARLGKPTIALPRINQSHAGSAPAEETLPQDIVERFRQENTLDYLIYDYCLERFRQDQANFRA